MWFTYAPKEAEKRDPEDEQDQVPCPYQCKFEDEGQKVEQGRESRQTADYFSENLFVVSDPSREQTKTILTHFPSAWTPAFAARLSSYP
jgi:hypothetical protein